MSEEEQMQEVYCKTAAVITQLTLGIKVIIVLDPMFKLHFTNHLVRQ